MGAALATVAKKAATVFLSDPQKLLKVIGYVFLVLLGILILLALPVIILISFPVLLVNSAMGATEDPAITQAQLETIAFYQNAPITLGNIATQWIEDKTAKYAWCDDIQVDNSFILTWQDIMAIDSVLLEQDFSEATNNHVLDIGKKFIVYSATTEKYLAEEQYREEESFTVEEPYYDSAAKAWKTRTVTKTREVTKTRLVEKTRAVISVTTKPFAQVIDEIGFDAEQSDIATNIYTTILQYDIEGQLNIYDDLDLSDLKEYPPGSAKLPYFNQTDARWGAYGYGRTGTIASSGCGPTSLAMVVAGLTGRGDVNPKTVADWSASTGHRAEGNGSYWSLMTDGGDYYGLTVTTASRKDPEKIVSALSNGNPVIVAMGKGHFTRGGHFIVLRGLTADGKVLVHDPASVSRSDKAWDLSIIMNESSTNGGVNGSPFWIFK